VIDLVLHDVHHLSFHQKLGCIGPVAGHGFDSLACFGESLRFDLSEWARAGNAGNAGVLKFVACTGVELQRTDGRFPPSVRRASGRPLQGTLATFSTSKVWAALATCIVRRALME